MNRYVIQFSNRHQAAKEPSEVVSAADVILLEDRLLFLDDSSEVIAEYVRENIVGYRRLVLLQSADQARLAMERNTPPRQRPSPGQGIQQ